MTPHPETLITAAFTMIGLLGALSVSMVARYSKNHADFVEPSAESAA